MKITLGVISAFAAVLVIAGAIVFLYALRTNPAGGLIFLSCMVIGSFFVLFGLIWAHPSFLGRRGEDI